MLSQLYIASAMLKRYEDDGRPAAEQPLLAWAFHDSAHKIELALSGALRNFPIRPVRLAAVACWCSPGAVARRRRPIAWAIAPRRC